jgi:hypothetical protein
MQFNSLKKDQESGTPHRHTTKLIFNHKLKSKNLLKRRKNKLIKLPKHEQMMLKINFSSLMCVQQHTFTNEQSSFLVVFFGDDVSVDDGKAEQNRRD